MGAVYYQRNYIDKDIFELMPQLVYLYMRGCFRLHIILLAGTRQIAAEIYGFSRGHLTYGIVSYSSILDFVPLNDTACDHSASIFPWVKTWIGVNNIQPLTPEGWFEEGDGIREGKKNKDGICMPYYSKGIFNGCPPLQWQTWC